MATTSAAIDRARLLELIEQRAGRAARPHAGLAGRVRARRARSCRAACRARSRPPTRGRSTSPTARGRRSGTSTATSTSTSTTASASCASATRTRRSCAAVSERAARGSHFAAPTDGSIVVAQELRRRFGLPQWRFTNSGHRVDDGRDPPRPRRDRPRPRAEDRGLLPRPSRRRDGVGPPAARRSSARATSRAACRSAAATRRRSRSSRRRSPFNDADLLERVLDDIGDQVAALILEPAMMNITIVCPSAGLPRARARAVRRATASS